MITAKVHGYLDYISALFFFLAPSLVPLSETGTLLAYALGGVLFLMTLLTAFDMGLLKVIPFQLHGFVEFVASILLMAAPWILSDFFSGIDQFFYTIVGMVMLIGWTLSSYQNSLTE